MFSFKLDKSRLDKIIPFCGTYLDIVYSNSLVIIASESGLSYIHLVCQAVSETGDDKIGFRVESKIFQKLAISGKVEVEKFDTEVHISLYGSGDEVIYKYIVPSQTSFINFKRIFDIKKDSENCDVYNIKTEDKLVKLASKNNSNLVSGDGYCYIYYKNSYIFCKSELPAFSVDGTLFKNAISIVNRFILVGDSIFLADDDIVICIRRSKLPISSDIPMLVQSKAIHKYELDFGRLNRLMDSLEANEYSIKLNLSVNKCFVECDKGKFEAIVPDVSGKEEVKVSLDDMLSSLKSEPLIPKKVSQKIIKIPSWVFKILDNTAKVTLYVKRNTCLIVFNKACVVFSGGYLNEN